MDNKELMKHISRIILVGEERIIEYSLRELLDILKRNKAPSEQVYLLERAMGVKGELAELGVLKFGEEISEREFNNAVNRAYARRRGK